MPRYRVTFEFEAKGLDDAFYAGYCIKTAFAEDPRFTTQETKMYGPNVTRATVEAYKARQTATHA